MKKSATWLSACLVASGLLMGIFLCFSVAPAAKAEDGKLEMHNEVITQENKESPGSAKTPKAPRIKGLLLSSRQEKVKAIQQREREQLERARNSQFLVREVKKSDKARKNEVLLTDRKPASGDLPKSIDNFESASAVALPSWLVYIPAILLIAALTAVGYFLGKKYARIFRAKG